MPTKTNIILTKNQALFRRHLGGSPARILVDKTQAAVNTVTALQSQATFCKNLSKTISGRHTFPKAPICVAEPVSKMPYFSNEISAFLQTCLDLHASCVFFFFLEILQKPLQNKGKITLCESVFLVFFKDFEGSSCLLGCHSKVAAYLIFAKCASYGRAVNTFYMGHLGCLSKMLA